MSDLTKRLRAMPATTTGAPPLVCNLAADRIEQLEAALRDTRDVIVRQNRLGATWHQEVFGDMMASLSKASALIGEASER